MKQPKKKQPAVDLRQKAEAILQKKKLKSGADHHEADYIKLIHSLEVQQIELELQQKEILLTKELSDLATEKYAELYDFSPTAYYTFSRDGRILEMNLNGAKMLGKERENLKNRDFILFVADTDKPVFALFLDQLFESNQQQKTNLILHSSDQQIIHVSLTGIATANKQQCLVTVLDVTNEWYYNELRNLEKSVFEMNVSGNKNMQEVIFTYIAGLEKLHSGMMCCLLEKKGNLLYNIASPTLPAAFLATMEGKEITSNIFPHEKSIILQQSIQLSDIENDICSAYFKTNAKLHYLKACATYPLFDKMGNVMAVFCVFLNKKQLQIFTHEYAIDKAWHILQIMLQNYYEAAQLKASEDKFRLLVNDMQVGVILQSPNAEIIMCNPKALILLGLTENELLGKTSFDADWNVIHEDGTNFPGETHPVVQAIATVRPVRKVVMGVYRPSKKDRIWLLVDAIPQLQEDGSIRQVVCTFTNITSLVIAKESLRKSRLLLSQTELMGKIGGWEFDVVTLQQSWTEETFHILEIDTNNGAPEVPEGLGFFTAECRPIAEEKIKQAIEFGEPYNEEWEVITAKGNKRWVHAVARVEQENGKTIKVSGSFQDISKRKKAELELRESEGRFRSLLNNLEVGIVVHAADTSIINSNPKASLLLGLTEDQLKGKHAIDPSWHFIYEDRSPVSLDKYPVNQILNSKKPIQHKIAGINRPATNDVVWVMVNGFPVLDSSGQIKEIVVSFIEISDLKIAEENLKQSNADLAQFAYAASHDLQEPLRMITGFLTLIEKKYAGTIDETGKSYINYAVDGAKRMQQLIHDLLEFARIGKTNYNLEPINIKHLIEEIEMLYQQRITEKNALIKLPLKLPVIHGYKAPTRQAFLNLIANALTYSRDGLQPTITIEFTENTDSWQFSVADNGIGIAGYNHQKIFEIFKRLHSSDEYSGTGIGLAVTKKVIELQGGKIWLKSEEGVGTTFFFTIKK